MTIIQASLGAEDFRYPLEQSEFSTIAAMLYKEAGITLGPTKRDLVQGRLARRLRALGCADFAAYIALVQGSDGFAERRQMINALTTNLTGFFREQHHFDFLGDEILPQLSRLREGAKRRLRIWSAGCSSGEEPYSIAMTVHSRLTDIDRWDAKILATDIDTDMVASGQAGSYDASRAERVSKEMRLRYMKPSRGTETLHISDQLRSIISFRYLNLLEPWPMSGPFDIIFCRNVVIYFDKPTQRRLFDRFADLLIPGGWLFIGHSESLFHVCDRFEHLGRTIYRRTA